ncbi:MAG: radical SAM protein [bacterium]|nr:radical SAM protein [bacterium]
MINITRLYCGEETPSDDLRYGRKINKSHHRLGQGWEGLTNSRIPLSASERRPIVVWNSTRTCNLKCVHCYTDSENIPYQGELTTDEAKAMLADLGRFKVPAILFSGGEPLIRKDLFELAAYALEQGVKPTLSTNGTLITKEVARKLKEVGFTYVGISLDGIGEVNDQFRGVAGAFERAMRGFRNCVEVGQRVGLRLTLTRRNAKDLHRIFDFIEAEDIDRACFYHLVYSGRGIDIRNDDLTAEESRKAMDIILERSEDFARRGLAKEILTVDNHVDGIYLYLKLKQKNPQRAKEVMELLTWNGGGLYSTGVGIGEIDFCGNVHPDQFWLDYTLGNVRERPFSEIWMDTRDPIMAGLKNRKPLLKGKCSRCRWIDACGGSFRVRALRVYGDPWMEDPQCYLTPEECGISDQ